LGAVGQLELANTEADASKSKIKGKVVFMMRIRLKVLLLDFVCGG